MQALLSGPISEAIYVFHPLFVNRYIQALRFWILDGDFYSGFLVMHQEEAQLP